MEPIRVVIADDHDLVRTSLSRILDTSPDIQVVGEAAHCGEVLPLTIEVQPDVLLLDITMPGGDGLELIKPILAESPGTRVLILTGHGRFEYLRQAIAQGAMGYIVKSVASEELGAAIRSVHEGRPYVNVSLDDRSVQTLISGEASAPNDPKVDPSLLDSLSPREREVLEAIAFGHTQKAIAEQLDLSIKTVETYRSRVAAKLGAKNRAELVRYAIAAGLLDRP